MGWLVGWLNNQKVLRDNVNPGLSTYLVDFDRGVSPLVGIQTTFERNTGNTPPKNGTGLLTLGQQNQTTLATNSLQATRVLQSLAKACRRGPPPTGQWAFADLMVFF